MKMSDATGDNPAMGVKCGRVSPLKAMKVA